MREFVGEVEGFMFSIEILSLGSTTKAQYSLST
jgi:hypothetical protein